MIFKSSKLFELKRTKQMQEQAMKTNCDDYMVGLYNGLELAVAIMENRVPELISINKEPEQVENKEEQKTGRTCYNGIILREEFR